MKNKDENISSNEIAQKSKETLLENDNKKKKNSTRRVIVLVILIIALIVTYIWARGNYLEIKEIGENYLSVYLRSSLYTGIIFMVNFVFLYVVTYITTRKLKNTLKIFFDD